MGAKYPKNRKKTNSKGMNNASARPGSSTGVPNWNRPPRRSGTVNLCIRAAVDAQIEHGYRIRRDVETATAIWNKSTSRHFSGVTFDIIDLKAIETNINTEIFSIDRNIHASEIKAMVDAAACEAADVTVFYLPGKFISTNHPFSLVVARYYPVHRVIIMSEGAVANPYFLAHELGHALFTTNSRGYYDDPDPQRKDNAHNRNEGNLMYKGLSSRTVPTITNEQIGKALYSTLFR